MLDRVGATQRLVDDRLQRDVLALAIGHVRGEDEARAAGDDAVAQRPRAEAGEDDRVDRADADHASISDDRFRASSACRP